MINSNLNETFFLIATLDWADIAHRGMYDLDGKWYEVDWRQKVSYKLPNT